MNPTQELEDILGSFDFEFLNNKLYKAKEISLAILKKYISREEVLTDLKNCKITQQSINELRDKEDITALIYCNVVNARIDHLITNKLKGKDEI